jgi:hypothetical protein
MSGEASIDNLNKLSQEYFYCLPAACGESLCGAIPPAGQSLEDAIRKSVWMFARLDKPERHGMSARLNQYSRNSLLNHAYEMAESAIRSSSPDLVEEGLISLILEGGIEDWRYSIVGMAVLFHSATRLGLDTERLFHDVAGLSDFGSVSREMVQFPSRRPDERCLDAFFLREGSGPEGFEYIQFRT